MIKIISHSSEAFKDRAEAGILLAEQLKPFEKENLVILGIPRGGILIGWQVAKILKADLDIVLSRKLGAPGNPELAIGAVGENGRLFLNEELASSAGADKAYIEEEKTLQLSEIKRRIGEFRQVRPKIPLKGKTVIITDDGVATGATMQAALLACRQENPAKLVVGIPVAAEDSISRLADLADEMIVLRVPEFLGAIGEFYTDFSPVEDSEVLELLKNQKGG